MAARCASYDALCLELLRLLRQGVADGQLICPISETVFLELMKQRGDSTRLLATAKLIDELSLGATLMRSDARIGTEVRSFLLTALGEGSDLHPMQELVWTTVAYVLGEMHPTIPWADAATEFSLQQSFVDRMWKVSLAEIVTRCGDPPAILSQAGHQSRLATQLTAAEINVPCRSAGVSANSSPTIVPPLRRTPGRRRTWFRRATVTSAFQWPIDIAPALGRLSVVTA